MRLNRAQKAGPLLEWKVRLFSIGAVLGLAGIFTEERWLTGSAIGVLALAGLTRFLPGGREGHGGSDEDDEEDEGGEDDENDEEDEGGEDDENDENDEEDEEDQGPGLV